MPTGYGILGPLDATFTSLADIPDVQPTTDAPGYKGWRNTHRKTNSHFEYVNDEKRDQMTDEKSVHWFESKIKQLEDKQHPDPFS